MKPLQVFLEQDIHTELKLLAIKENTSVSELVRDLLVGVVGTPKEISPPSKIKASKNIKTNDNGTLSPIDPTKPSEIITEWDIPKEVSDNFTEINYKGMNTAERILAKAKNG